MPRPSIDVEEQGPIRLVVSGHIRGLAIVGQDAINEIIRKKFYGTVDSPYAAAPFFRVTIEQLHEEELH